MNVSSFIVSRILKPVLKLFSGNLVAALLGLLTISFFIKEIGLVEYGDFVYSLVVVQIISLVVNAQTWQAITLCYEEGKIVNRDRLRSIMIFEVALNICAFLFSFLVLTLLDSEFQFLAFYPLLNNLNAFMGVTRGRRLYLLASLITVLIECIKLYAVYLFSINDLGGDSFSFLWAISAWIYGLFILAYFISEKLYAGFKYIRFESWLDMSLKIHLKNMSDLPISHLDRLVVNWNLGSEGLALFDVMKKVGYGFGRLLGPIWQVIFTELKSFSGKELHLLISLAFGLGGIGLISVLPLYVTYDYWGAVLLGEASGGAVKYFLIMQVWIFMSLVVHIYFQYVGLYMLDAKITILSNILYIVILPLLLTNIGLEGAVLAMALHSILVVLVKSRILCKKLS